MRLQSRVYFLSSVTLGSVCIFVLLLFFSPKFLPDIKKAFAASISWDGGGVDNDWCTPENWSTDTLPTGADDVTIDTAVSVTTSGCTDGEIEFGWLSIGANAAVTLTVGVTLGTAGDLSVETNGTLVQDMVDTIVLTGTLTVETGGTITHSINTDSSGADGWTENAKVVIQAADAVIDGTINVNEKGYQAPGGSLGYSGRGPGGGIRNSSLFGGGGYGGKGGEISTSYVDVAGGAAYGYVVTSTNVGSSGAQASTAASGAGGGSVHLILTNDSGTVLSLDGSITANGGTGGTVGGLSSGGGSGGGIMIQASGGTISGTGSITATGGTNGNTTADAGAGGGGRVSIIGYDTLSGITHTAYGAAGSGSGTDGGVGTVYLQASGENGQLILDNRGESNIAYGYVTSSEHLVLDSITIQDYAQFRMAEGTQITFTGNSFETPSDFFGWFFVWDGTFVITGSELIIPRDMLFLVSPSSTVETQSGDPIDLVINDSTGGTYAGYLRFDNFVTTSPAMEFRDITVYGIIDHSRNDASNTLTDSVQLKARTITIESGGLLRANNGTGYRVIKSASGYGPGAGNKNGLYGSGGGHCGAGGSSGGAAGGTTYDSITFPTNHGSASGGYLNSQGDGGGTLAIEVTGSGDAFIIDGDLTVDGENGSSGTYGAGGGAGGSIYVNMSGNGNIVGTGSITARGGSGNNSSYDGGGGGGGCIAIINHSSLAGTLTTSTAGGSAPGTAGTPQPGGEGSFYTLAFVNTVPTATIGTPIQTSATKVTVTSTVSDVDNNDTTLQVEYSLDGSTWVSSTLGAVTVSEGSITTSTGQIAGIDTGIDGSVDFTIIWNIGADLPDTDDSTVYLRVLPSDSQTGSHATSTAFAVDTEAPSAPGPVTFGSLTDSSIQIVYPGVVSSDTNFAEYRIYYSTSTNPTIADSSITSSTVAALADSSFSGATSTLLSSLLPNRTYYMTLFAYDIFGYTSSSTIANTTTLAAVPSNLAVQSVTTSSIAVSWNANQNPNGTTYELRLDNDTLVTSTGSTSYTHTGLTPNTAYTYKVRALNSDDIPTSYTSTVTSTTLPVAPDAPSGVTISSISTSSLVVSWTDNSSDETGFLVDIAADGAFPGTTTTVGADSTNTTLTGLTPNTSYTVRVAAIGNTENSSYATSAASTTLATVPSNLSVQSIATSTISLSWERNGNPVGTTFELRLDNDTLVTSTTDVTYTHTGLTPESTYTYKVRALNSADEPSAYTSTVSTSTDPVAPLDPSSVVLSSVSTSSLVVSWTDNSSDETGFLVDIAANGSFPGTTTTVVADSTNTTLTGLTPNTSYTVRVQAIGATLDSNFVTSSATTTRSHVPSGLTVVDTSTSSITLTWESNGNPFGTVYELRLEDNTLVTSTTNTTTIHTGLTPSSTYVYKVRSVNSAGSASSYTDTVSAVTDPVAPTAPSDITITSVSTSSLDVTWTDNSSDEVTFLIDITSTTFPGNTATVSANTTNTTFTGLTPNTSYTVRVRAVGPTLSSSYATSTPTTTLANIPNAVTFGGTTTTIAFVWQANGNPDGTVYEAEHINSSLIVTTTDTFYSFDKTGFTPGEKQLFRVRAINDAGVYTEYATGYSITAPVSPSTPSNTVISTSTINVSINAELNGASTTYAIYDRIADSWIDTDGTMTGSAVYQDFGDWGGTTQVTGLTPNTRHSYVVYANTADVFSATSSPSTAVYTYAAVPTDFATTSVATSSIGLSWSANGNAAGTVYTVSTTDQVVTTTDTSITISNLAFDVNFVFELFATNGAGVDTTSVTISATTDYYNYVPVVQTVTPVQTSSSTASITVQAGDLNAFFMPGTGILHTFGFSTSSTSGPWTALTIDSAANIDSAGISVLGQDTVGQALTNAGSPPDSPEIDGFSVVWDLATDLAGYNGTVCVQVVTDDQRGGVVTTTPDCIVVATAVPEAPSDISIDTITTSTISISWTDNSDSETAFIIDYINSADVADFVGTTTTVAANSTSATITGLSPNRVYRFRVAAVGALGTSAYTTSTAVYTYTTAPVLSFAAKTTSSIQVGFTSADGGVSPLSDLTNLTTSAYATSTDGIFTLSGLTPNTSYQVAGRIYNTDVVPSATSSVSTFVTYAEAPTTISTTTVAATSVGLSWADSGASEYALYNQTTGNSLIATVADTSATIASLTCETSYIFWLSALNSLSEGSLTTTTISVTTAACPIDDTPTSTSGGGGTFIPPSVPNVDISLPEGDSFQLENGAETTPSQTVQAVFRGISNATQVALSNSLDFSGTSFVPFSGSISHMLSAGNGIKTVYAKLRSAQGGTLTLSDTIRLIGQAVLPGGTNTESCPLPVDSAAKAATNNAVYYITLDCTKRAFTRSDIYFTYFTSWSDVTVTTAATLSSIPDDALGFMPWGPRYNPASGALIKTPADPKVYLLLQGTLYHIENETAATYQFGPNWATWVEDVDSRLIDAYPLSDTELSTNMRPDGILIKYANDAKVYQLDTTDGRQVKRWIPSIEIFRSLNFRDDRIVTIPTSETYFDGATITL